MKKISFIIAVMVIVACANIPINDKPYDSHVDPDVIITWEHRVTGLEVTKGGDKYLHVVFKNPEAGEPQFVEAIHKLMGTTWVLVMYRYRYKGQMFGYALTRDNRYTQVYPKQSHI